MSKGLKTHTQKNTSGSSITSSLRAVKLQNAPVAFV